MIESGAIYGIVYCTTNVVTGMKYIGKRKYRNVPTDHTYLGSGIRLANAIRKYGRENFIREVLCECVSLQDMNEMEQYYIDYYGALASDMFYNLAKGGDGGDMSHVKLYKSVCQYDLSGNLIAVYRNAKEAERALPGYSNKSILTCCHGEKEKNKEFMFKFFKDTGGKEIRPYKVTKSAFRKRKVYCYTVGGEFVKEYSSIKEAQLALGISNVGAVALGKQKTAGGFVWKYETPINKQTKLP